MATKESCTLDNIRFCELAETTYTVSGIGAPLDIVDTYPTEARSPQPYTCERHGLDFTDWDDVKKHLEEAK